MTRIGVHHMSALNSTPADFIKMAADAGSDSVSIFTFGDSRRFPLVNQDNLAAVKTALKDSGLTVANIDAFSIGPDTKIADLLPALDLGVELGAQAVSAQILGSDLSQMMEKLGQLCELSLERGFKVGLEFLPFTSLCRNLAETIELIKALNCANLGMSMDILHLIRSGGTADDVAALSPDLICFAQVCDSQRLDATHDYMMEAVNGRLVPGKGKLPLQAFVAALPTDITIDIEIPNSAAGDPFERIKKALQATQFLVYKPC